MAYRFNGLELPQALVLLLRLARMMIWGFATRSAAFGRAGHSAYCHEGAHMTQSSRSWVCQFLPLEGPILSGGLQNQPDPLFDV